MCSSMFYLLSLKSHVCIGNFFLEILRASLNIVCHIIFNFNS